MRDRPKRPGRPQARSRPSAPVRAGRPATRRPAGGGSGPTTRTSAPRPSGRLTGRAVVLGVVLLVLALSYVLPLRIYLDQQAEISQLRGSQVAQRESIADLEAEADRWADDEYVRIQARKRLHYVEPGEVPMIVVWDDPEGGPSGDEPDSGQRQAAPWWQTLWSSVEAADQGDQADPDTSVSPPGEAADGEPDR